MIFTSAPTEIEVNNCLLYDFSFKNENFATFTFVVKDMFNLQTKDILTSFSNCYQNIIMKYFAFLNIY